MWRPTACRPSRPFGEELRTPREAWRWRPCRAPDVHSRQLGLRRLSHFMHPDFMGFLQRIRHSAPRSAYVRGLGLWLIAGLLLSGWMRWEVHAHADPGAAHEAAHGHSHHPSDGPATDVDAPAPSDTASVVHFHDVAPGAMALDSRVTRSLDAAPASRWVPPPPDMPLPASAGPPPHRPPIA